MRNQTRNKRTVGTVPLLLAAVLLLSAFLPLRALAAEPEPEETYLPVLYDIRSGMPFSEARALARTPEGFLYVGCFGGLLRYDGREFTRIENVMGVRALSPDGRGRLWIAADGILCLDRGELTRYGLADGLPSESVLDVTVDSAGTVWAATEGGLVSVSPEGRVSLPTDERLAASISCVSASAGGGVYGCTGAGDAFYMENGAVLAWHDAGEFAEAVNCVYADPSDSAQVYLGTMESRLYHGSLAGPVSAMTCRELPALRRINVLVRQGEALWIGTDNGICRLDGEGDLTLMDDLPFTSTIHDILCDGEGNVWFASSRQGLLKLAPNIFTDLSAGTVLDQRVVNSTWLKNGLLYVGTDTGLVVLDADWNPVTTSVSELLGSARVRAVKEDSAGNLWFCSYDENALVRLSEDGAVRVWNKDSGLVTNYVRTILERADGSLVLSESGGLELFENGEITRVWDEEHGFSASMVISMGETDDGALLLGTNGDGVYIIENDQAVPFPGPCDLTSGVILQVKNDPTRDLMWILSSNAVAVLSEGEIRVKTEFPQTHVYDILFAPDGGLWLLGAGGVYYIPAEDVTGTETARYEFFSVSTGLPHMTTANSRSYVSPEGDAYIACTDGLLGLNVSRHSNDHVGLTFTVPWLEADGVRILPEEDGSFTVPGGVKKLTVCCYALSYALGDTDVTYQLEGFDPLPETVSRKDLDAVTYTNLPGGTYRFLMARADDEEGEAPFSVTIVKEKSLTEKTGFRLAILAAMAALAAVVMLLLLWRQAAKAARQREKDRIAKELDMAAGIQTSMLPDTFPSREEFDLFASMDPAKEVGGDFYDFFPVDRDHLALVIADVSGKGVPAALFMMVSKTLLKNSTQPGVSPAAVLAEVNAQLCDGNENSMFVTVWLGILEISTGKLVWADAGHEQPALYRDGAWQLLPKHQGIALGMMEPELLELEEDPPFVDETLQLLPGDVLFQYTDGVPEATDKQEKLFGPERLLSALRDASTPEPRTLLPHVRQRIDEFVGGAPQFDDITMLALRYRGPAGKEGEA